MPFTTDRLEYEDKAVAMHCIGAGKLIRPLRVALTGRMSSPGILSYSSCSEETVRSTGIAHGVERARDLRVKHFLDTVETRALG